MPSLSHLIQIVYLVIDELTELSIQAETEIRDKTLKVIKGHSRYPNNVNITDLTNLRWQVDKLVSLIENQLYCVIGLNSSDNNVLQEPHRKAYVLDLVSELEIVQGGIRRLETRVNALYDSYQTVGGSQVEKTGCEY